MFYTINYNNLDLYLGTISDAVQFDFDDKAGHYVRLPRITQANKGIAGPAFTCYAQAVKNVEDIKDNIRIDMLKAMPPGCIQLLGGCYNYKDIAHYGDISALLASKRGAVGCVLDGYTRDVDAINKMDFPVWGEGAHVADAFGKWQITDYQVPITIGEKLVHPGDWLFCDSDGVFVVYAKYVERVIDCALSRTANESKIRSALQIKDPKEVYYEFGRW